MTATLQSHDQQLCRLPPGAIPTQRTAPPAGVLPAAPVRRGRRWPSAVSGFAAGLTVGAAVVGAVPAEASPAAPVEEYTANVSVPGRVLTAFGDGTWQVGVDIAPGTYTTTGSLEPVCRYAFTTAARGGEIVESTFVRGPATVVLAESDGYVATSGCTTWNRIG
jgi:hypothetical protein